MNQRKAASRAVAPPAPAPAPAPVSVSVPARVQLQSDLRVSSPSDPAEKEAESTARKVVRMAAPEPALPRRVVSPYVARFADAIGLARSRTLARRAEGQPDLRANMAAELASNTGSGSPLPLAVKNYMEPRFRADFSGVRIHTGEKAARFSKQVSARAFAVGNQIFFGRDRFKPETQEGKELIAHELTHTIQQGAAVQQGTGIQRSEDVSVTQHAPVQVQRGLLDDLIDKALDWFSGWADEIPGFQMLCVVLGKNPITKAKVNRSPANILSAIVGLIVPVGPQISKALNNHGITDKIANFVADQISSLGLAADAIYGAVMGFLRSFDKTDLIRPRKVWDKAKQHFSAPIDQIKDFFTGLVSGIVGLIKDLILKPLGAFAAAQFPNAWNLLKAVLEKDPITGEHFPRNAETLIGGLLNLANQGDVWQKIQETKAIPKITAWFNTNVKQLLGFVKAIPATFLGALKALVLTDILELPATFKKVVSIFTSFAASFIGWATNAAWDLLEIVFNVVKPGAIGYVKQTGAALKSILKNPLPFVGNLGRAAKLGFQNFAGNFVTHLKAGLINWLTGSMPGVYIPKAFTLGEVVKFVFSVLGISWANIRQKLVKVVGETVVKGMETGFDIVMTLVTQGPAAAWEKIKDQLANLRDQVISGLVQMAVEAVVQKAVPKLVAMFIPGAGFITAIVSIYDIVMVFVQKIAQIMAVVNAFVSSIVAIAAGNIGAAAGKVEKILAGLLSLAISFLMQFAGLGKAAAKIMEVIGKLRAMVDKAIDWLVNWIVTMGKKLFSKIFGKDKKDERTDAQKLDDLKKAVAEADKLAVAKDASPKKVMKALSAIQKRYKLTALALVSDGKDKYHVRGEINPINEAPPHVIVGSIEELVAAAPEPAKSELIAKVKAAQDSQALAMKVQDIVRSGGGPAPVAAHEQKTVGAAVLPSGQTIATVSGFESLTKRQQQAVADKLGITLMPQDISKARAYYEAHRAEFQALGYEKPLGHPADPKRATKKDPEAKPDPGKTSLSHAEKQAEALGATAIGVGLNVCGTDCYPYFYALAQIKQTTIVIADPSTIYVFSPSGPVKCVPRPKK